MNRLVIVPLLLSQALAFSSTTETFQAVTVTKPGATTIAQVDGTLTTLTIPPATLSASAETITSLIQPPFCQGSNGNNCHDIESAAPGITTLASAQVSSIIDQVEQFYSTYKAGEPRPHLDSIYEEFLEYFNTDDPAESRVAEQIATNIWPFQAPSAISQGLDALKPYPTLQADVKSWMESIRSYYAEPFLVEASIVSKVLTVTEPPPAWLSYAAEAAASASASASMTGSGSTSVTGSGSSAAATGTAATSTGSSMTSSMVASTTSKNAACPTTVDSWLWSACVAAVGIAGVVGL